jgi:hypothetical protein
VARPCAAATAAAVVLGGLLGASLAGCGDRSSGGEPTEQDADPSIVKGGEPSDPAVDVPAPDASFDADVVVEGDTVRVSYHVTNDGTTPLLLVNQVPDRGSSGALSDTRAYVVGGVAGGPDGLVQVGHRLFARPDTDRMSWDSDPDVGLTRLRPGRSLDVQVEVPLERYSPWGDDLGYGTIELPDPVEEVEFCLGVVAEPDPSRIIEQDGDALMTTHGSTSDQYLFCTDPASA